MKRPLPLDRKTLYVLLDREWHSTKGLTDLTKIGFPPRSINRLKNCGYIIESRMGEVWKEYRLVATASEAALIEEDIAQKDKVLDDLKPADTVLKENMPALSAEEKSIQQRLFDVRPTYI